MAAVDPAARALEALVARGFDKARVMLTTTEHHELSAEFGHMNLLRTNHDTTLSLLGIVGDRQGTLTVNRTADASIAEAIEDLWQVTQGSKPDPANDIAPAQSPATFETGDEAPDRDAMFARLAEVLDHAATSYPTLRMGQSVVSFANRRSRFLNSNGVDFTSRRGRYHVSLMFTAREGTDVSSFNYTGFTAKSLDRPFAECGTTDTLLRQTTEQVRTQRIPGKFEGEVIVTPDCLGDFLGFLTHRVSDLPIVSGTSLYAGRLGDTVASSALSLSSRPRDLIGGYFLTGDGYVAENAWLLERGVLKSYLLSLYGARKTGLARARTAGGCLVVESGVRSLAEILADVDRGLLVTRFSGGAPNDKGDFSGIAKNSYYIEGGALRYPVAETMISGNMAKLLENVVELSRERADFGDAIFPWCRVRGIGVS